VSPSEDLQPPRRECRLRVEDRYGAITDDLWSALTDPGRLASYGDGDCDGTVLVLEGTPEVGHPADKRAAIALSVVFPQNTWLLAQVYDHLESINSNWLE